MEIQDFLHDFHQELLASAEANANFVEAEFMAIVSDELIETGFIEGFEYCHYRPEGRGPRVDGYWFSDEGILDLFVADFENTDNLRSLTRTQVGAVFKRIESFVEKSCDRKFYEALEESTEAYGLARQIHESFSDIIKVNFYIFSNKTLSERLTHLEDNLVAGKPASYHIWDISRLMRQKTSRSHKEELDLDLVGLYGKPIACLPANLGSSLYQSYLLVMPATILADLYGRYGARLLEQNVRCFLQARAKVNSGIRNTILKEPEMFFAFNNGITSTALSVDIRSDGGALYLHGIKDLQIVNGGQTTASLFHAMKKDKADLEHIFVQMKLSVVSIENGEQMVSRISEYANTQNKVNAADFFSNHPFHIRMEDFSRRVWAPPKDGEQRETKWFYERARGQYLDAQSKLTVAEQKKFKAAYPKTQMFTKTDLAKIDNVWDEHPKWVNLGAEKNFAQFAKRIGALWDKNPDDFNELFFKKVVARYIIFRATERLVSEQSWYDGGHRAQIVAYAIALVSEVVRRNNASINYQFIWQKQSVDNVLCEALALSAKYCYEIIMDTPPGISNVGEWCKKDACWSRMLFGIDRLISQLPSSFFNNLLADDLAKALSEDAKKIQKIDNGILCQREVIELGAEFWKKVAQKGMTEKSLSGKEIDILNIAVLIPKKIPSEKQSTVLMQLLKKLSIGN